MTGSKYSVLNQISKATRDGRYISGQEIADSLRLTRSAVNKAVRALREEGYAIDAVNHKGYRIENDPDLINPGELLTFLDEDRVEKIAIYDSVVSTNVILHELAENGGETGQVAVASSQTSGRGRNGSRFDSPDNKSIYMSYLLRPTDDTDIKGITPAVARVVADVINTETGAKVIADESGDVKLKGKKICGILTEILSEAESGYIRYIMIGVGIRPVKVKRAALLAGVIKGIDDIFARLR